ncbi:galactose oxidase [Alteromonas sediminis]|uniref:Galactose oxidase n=1 Tax=Alteromonas sediminis TaxID=2259342 RepID=A0A3N5YDG6_9ALTE|nr:kelch repeat-containing protein [Alteromonas sediminis]RPJ67605.1 galactose oxidase [Alteromonas sediminis]
MPIKKSWFPLLCAALVSSAAWAGPSTWQKGIDLPEPTQEIYPTVHGGSIVVAGGINASQPDWQIHTAVWAWSEGDMAWSSLPSLPEPWHHGILVSWQGELLHIGGFTRSEQGSWVNRNDVLRLDGEKWVRHSRLPMPLSESNVAVLHGRLHLAGGRSPSGSENSQWGHQSDVAVHWYYDTDTQTWLPAKPLPSPRNSTCSIVVDDQWYILGGRTVGGGNVASNERYDAKNDSWTTLSPMPQAQGGLACASINGDIFAFGGEFFTGDGGVYKDVWRYVIKDDTWHRAGEMPVPRHGLGAVSYNGRIAVIAGAAKVGGSDTQNRVSWFSFAN